MKEGWGEIESRIMLHPHEHKIMKYNDFIWL